MNRNQIMHIQSELDSLSLNIGENIETIQRVIEMRASLQALHEIVEKTSLVPIVLRALPFTYINYVTTINVTNNKPNFQQLVNMLP